MQRVRSDFWVSAYLRRCDIEGIAAALRRRGAAEAGVIFVKVDHMNGEASLYGPAPQSLIGLEAVDRSFVALAQWVGAADIEARIAREIRFDTDLWLVEIDARDGRHLLPLCDEKTLPTVKI